MSELKQPTSDTGADAARVNVDYAPQLEAQPMALFETPIVCGRLKGADPLIAELRASILQQMAENPGVSRSNLGGWHSASNMLAWGGRAAKVVAETAVSIARRMSHFQEHKPDDFDWNVVMWANVTGNGGLNHMHVHPGNLWAAVFYVDLGNDGDANADVGGNFYLEDPRFPLNAMRMTSLRLRGIDGKPQVFQPELKSEPGSIIVFPAWLRHGVRPYYGTAQRISIALNIDARPKLAR